MTARPSDGRHGAPLPEVIAAVDLGSNSFHLAIARVVDGALTTVDRLGERVQLAAGLDADRQLSEDAQERAIGCLERFGQRLRGRPRAAVRAVGTDTFRIARNARAFIARASAALGHPIEVIAGEEEARLIYRGVVHELPHEDGLRQLVIDIGGGSTECVVGRGLDHEHVASLHLGCVSYTQRYFADGLITEEGFRRATIAARLQFERLRGPFFRGAWARTVGSSGTINAVFNLARDNGWSDGGIDYDSIVALRAHLIAAGSVDALSLPGLKPSRAPVLAGGVAILAAAFETLPLRELYASGSALREGVMYDLLGRFVQRDVRETTIRNLMERFRVDEDQAQRVEDTARACLGAAAWFDDGAERVIATRYLSWAARLHELGLAISFHDYHKHGAYVVRSSDMPGFSNDDKHVVATLVLTQRRKLARPDFDELPSGLGDMTRRVAVFLRLAVHLNRNRSWRPPPDVDLETDGDNHVIITFPAGFLANNPLTSASFEAEAARLASAGFRLTVRDRASNI